MRGKIVRKLAAAGMSAIVAASAARAARAAVAGNYAAEFPNPWWVIGYAAVLLTAAIAVFSVKLKKN